MRFEVGEFVCWLQGRIQEFLVGGGGPNSTRYVETVLQLITSSLRQFSIIVYHIP